MSKSKAASWARNAKAALYSAKFKISPVLCVSTQLSQSKRFKQGWREFGGKRCFYRSRWEANYGMYLEYQKQSGIIFDWLHEPQTFWFDKIKRGIVTYLPDFKIINLDGSHEWVEVKGHMDSKSRTKIKRFRKYYPQEALSVVGAKWYNSNKEKLSILIPGWEKG